MKNNLESRGSCRATGRVGKSLRRTLPAILATAAASFAAAPQQASATTFTVTTLNDSGAGSLRAMVGLAKNGDMITFAQGLQGTIVMSSGQFIINNNITIAGPGPSILAISGPSSFCDLPTPASVIAISGLTIKDCDAPTGSGGAIASTGVLTISNCSFIHNTTLGGNGGAIYMSSGFTTIRDSTFELNSTTSSGGAIEVAAGSLTVENSTFELNTATGAGGAIDASSDQGYSTITLNGCTFDKNTSVTSAGGAINSNADNASRSTNVTNCTFTHNTAVDGGAISTTDIGETLNVTNSTFVLNTASGYGGAINNNCNTTLSSCIIGENSAPSGPDIGFNYGILTSSGSNLIGDGSTTGSTFTAPHDQVGTTDAPINPLIHILADNGGPTLTMALLPGSPAIDADYNNPGIGVDQRGVTRPKGVRNDIGAYEYSPAASPTPIINAFTPTSGTTGTTVTITGLGFTGATGVAFNGVAATAITVASDSIIVATVPVGATTGPISVTGPGGTKTSAAKFTVLTVAPKITSFTPASAPVGGLVAISGSGLTGASAVKFNTTAAVSFSVLSDTVVVANVPAGATTGKIVVTTPGGTVVSPLAFTVIPAPKINAFAPVSGPAGTVVAISGTGLSTTTAVLFGGVTAASFTKLSDSVITAIVPTGAMTGVITVTTAAGYGSSSTNFAVGFPGPVISSFAPATGPIGATVSISGIALTGTTAVKFNGIAATSVIPISDTVVLATVPAGASTGKVSLTAAGGTVTSSGNFTIPALVPAISGFSPAAGAVGTAVVISGTNLSGVTSVKFNNTAATSIKVVSDTAVVATVPVGATTGAISVTTPGGTATGGTFAVTNVTPTITSIAPKNGPVGTQVVISGTNLAGVTSVKFNTTPAISYTLVSNSVLLATVPAKATTGKISITTAGGSATSTDNFTVAVAVPTIKSFTPAAGPVGTSVIISGTGFTGATSVKFNTTAAVKPTVASDSLIVATVPAGATTGKISVTTAGGTVTSPTNFNVTATVAAHVGSVSASGSGPGSTALISGTGFTGATGVSFDGKPASSVTVVSDSVIIATIPAGAKTDKIMVTGGGIHKNVSTPTVK